jgi:uncharacterized protein YndB with AHSA1/START domain
MIQLQFETTIQATATRVWEILWNKHSYPLWTAAFAPDCYYTSNWQQGSEILFMGAAGNGIYGIINQLDAPNHVAFQHLGMVQHFEKTTNAPPFENLIETYTLEPHGNTIILKVTISCVEEYKSFFETTFPQALQIVQNIAEHKMPVAITISTTINATIAKVWDSYTTPLHIMQWNHASDDWHTTEATVDLKVGGKHSGIMAAKDGSMSFDFWGIYTQIEMYKLLQSKLGDGRNMTTTFAQQENTVLVTQVFDAETENTLDLQENGWQAILNNFKIHTENNM